MEWLLLAESGILSRIPMIRCSPRGICSWVFLLDGDGHHAETRFSWIGEQGRIVIDGEPFEVRKVGFFRGQWEMVGASGLIVRAKKTSAFRRSFELSTPHGGLGLLKSVSLFGRSMDLSGTAADCVIAPVHAFTRRATIEGEIRDLRIVVFAFWLTALIWRRGSAANTNGNAVVLR